MSHKECIQWLAAAAIAVLPDGASIAAIAQALSTSSAAQTFLDGTERALSVSAGDQVTIAAVVSVTPSGASSVVFINTSARPLTPEVMASSVTVMTLPSQPARSLSSVLQSVYLPLLMNSTSDSTAKGAAHELLQQLDTALSQSWHQQIAASGIQPSDLIVSPEDEVRPKPRVLCMSYSQMSAVLAWSGLQRCCCVRYAETTQHHCTPSLACRCSTGDASHSPQPPWPC